MGSDQKFICQKSHNNKEAASKCINISMSTAPNEGGGSSDEEEEDDEVTGEAGTTATANAPLANTSNKDLSSLTDT